MQLAATRIITDDVDALVAFYETATGITAVRLHPMFAELRTPFGTLAFASTATVPLLGDHAAEARANHSIILDFLVDDVDASYEALQDVVEVFVNKPTDMPWGNRSLLVRDPDGNLINFFTPSSETTPTRLANEAQEQSLENKGAQVSNERHHGSRRPDRSDRERPLRRLAA